MQQELTLFRDSIAKFIDKEIAPYYEQWEKQEIFPRELWQKLGSQGLLAVDIPENYGGFGGNFDFSVAVIEEFLRHNYTSIGLPMMVHSDIVAHYLLNNGSEQQKQHYLPKMVSGDCVGAIAMTEPDAGSDLQSIRTTAKRDGDDYIINGAKTFITNGQLCDLAVVAARTNTAVAGSKGTTLFLVDSDSVGFTRGRNLEKIGMHASDTSELFFDNVRVPASAILGQLDRGFAVLMNELKRERLALAIGAIANAEGVLAQTIDYVKQRQAFGAPLSKLQNTRFKLAEIATQVRVHRAFVDECKTSFLNDSLDVATVSMAKVACSETQWLTADTCLQLHGGYGYMREYGVSRALVDSRIQRIYGGANEVMKELISRSLLD